MVINDIKPPRTPKSIQSLPPELHLHILSYLQWHDQVCSAQILRVYRREIAKERYHRERYEPQNFKATLPPHTQDTSFPKDLMPYNSIHKLISGLFSYRSVRNHPPHHCLFRPAGENRGLVLSIVHNTNHCKKANGRKTENSKYQELPGSVLMTR